MTALTAQCTEQQQAALRGNSKGDMSRASPRTFAHDEVLLDACLGAANLASALIHIAEAGELLRHLQTYSEGGRNRCRCNVRSQKAGRLLMQSMLLTMSCWQQQDSVMSGASAIDNIRTGVANVAPSETWTSSSIPGFRICWHDVVLCQQRR